MTITHYGEGGGLAKLSNYLEDDWGDNALTGRSSVSTGQYQEQLSGGVGDLLKAIYRPEWLSVKGSPSASSGVLNVGPDESVATPSIFTVGSWNVDASVSGAIDSGESPQVQIMAKDTPSNSAEMSADSYQFILIGSGLDFEKVVGTTRTTLINGTWANDTVAHTFKTTRDEDGNFELLYDGTSQGTASDTAHTTSQYVGIGCNMDTETFEVHNLTVN